MLLCILGPTAVGKTAISIAVAEALEAEIVSADSRQIYRYMDIGTAKPTPAEQARVRHHLVGFVEPDERFSVADYQRVADKAIHDIRSRDKQPMLVGGAGLYFRAVVDGLFDGPDADVELRAKLRREAQEYGMDTLHNRLVTIDPIAASRIHKNDLKRIIRALEVYEKTGKPISALQQQWQRADSCADDLSRRHTKLRYPFLAIGLNRARCELYQRINKRADAMLEVGLLEEVKVLLARGYDKNSSAMQSFGYKELIGHLDGKQDWQTAVELLKRNTRRFAKRQLTWFRNDPRIQWINLSECASFDKAVTRIQKEVLNIKREM